MAGLLYRDGRSTQDEKDGENMIQCLLTSENGTIEKVPEPCSGCWVSVVAPTDEERAWLEGELGVLPEFVSSALDDEETSTCVIINDRDLVTRVFFYQGPQGHAVETGVRLNRMAKASVNVHFCTGQPAYYISLMEELKGGRRISLDPAQEVHRVWNADLVSQALPMADALFCNDLEAGTICRYLQLGDVMEVDLPLVVRTEGDKGSTAKVGDEVMHIPAVKAERVVDVTGAGDNYRAGFYAALYRGIDVPEALVIASAVSSFAVEEVGALNNIPTWEAVLERADPYFGRIC